MSPQNNSLDQIKEERDRLRGELKELQAETERLERERQDDRIDKLEQWRLIVIAQLAVIMTKIAMIGVVCGGVGGIGGTLLVKLLTK